MNSCAREIATWGEKFGIPFNFIMLNKYEGGNHYIGPHSDDEKCLGGVPVIISLSLQEKDCERFILINKETKQKHIFFVKHGVLLIMRGFCQSKYTHTLMKESRCKHTRINVTLRWVFPVGEKMNFKECNLPLHQKLSLGPERFTGNIPGLVEGVLFETREELYKSSMHRRTIGGICGTKKQGAESILICGDGKYENIDLGNVITYCSSKSGKAAMEYSFKNGLPLGLFAKQILSHPMLRSRILVQRTFLHRRYFPARWPNTSSNSISSSLNYLN